MIRLVTAFLLLLAGSAWATPPASLMLRPQPVFYNFSAAPNIPGWITYTRSACTPSSTCATNGQYMDAAGAAYTSFGTNVPVFLPGVGVGSYEVRTNYLINSDAAVTQTTGTIPIGTYVLFCNGTGSITVTLGTATATGQSTTTCNSSTYQTIVVTVAGTLVATLSGSVSWMDLQNCLATNNIPAPTPHIVTGAATVQRSVDAFALSGSFLTLGQINQNSATYVFEFMQMATGTTSSLMASSTTGKFSVYSRVNGTNSDHPYSAIAGITTEATCTSAPTRGALTRIGATVNPKNWQMAMNGTICSKGSSATLTSSPPTTAMFDKLDGWVSQIVMYPYVLNPQTLTAKTVLGTPLP